MAMADKPAQEGIVKGKVGGIQSASVRGRPGRYGKSEKEGENAVTNIKLIKYQLLSGLAIIKFRLI